MGKMREVNRWMLENGAESYSGFHEFFFSAPACFNRPLIDFERRRRKSRRSEREITITWKEE